MPRTLRLARNTIRDLTPLGALDSLAVLDLSNNDLFSLAPRNPLWANASKPGL